MPHFCRASSARRPRGCARKRPGPVKGEGCGRRFRGRARRSATVVRRLPVTRGCGEKPAGQHHVEPIGNGWRHVTPGPCFTRFARAAARLCCVLPRIAGRDSQRASQVCEASSRNARSSRTVPNGHLCAPGLPLRWRARRRSAEARCAGLSLMRGVRPTYPRRAAVGPQRAAWAATWRRWSAARLTSATRWSPPSRSMISGPV